MIELAAEIAACAADTEAFLDARLSATGALARTPARLLAAMRHGALDGGKRLRPFLLRAGGQMFGVDPTASIAAGSALEMIHCYSLIHDDLPAMDNDELRRGKPTVWKAFDPALAILAGDALLTEAFALLADAATHADPAVRSALVLELAQCAGARGMVGGQVLDIDGEGGTLPAEAIVMMQGMKTGRLFRAGVVMGALLGGAPSAAIVALMQWASAAGLVFQLADDILDVTATSAALGKTAGKDIGQAKSTLVARLGLDAARIRLAAGIADADRALAGFGAEADRLRALVRLFAERQH
jgi:farnesyl diphosphate synthase